MNCASQHIRGESPASPEFWQGVWKTMQDELRRRIPADEHDLWVKPATLLRVMEGPTSLFMTIPRVFLERSGRLLVSVKDFGLLECWADAGISPGIVLRGIDEMFEKYVDLSRERRKINSIAFCGPAVLAAARAHKEAGTGSHRDPERFPDQTLLIALPRKGRAIYKAVARRQMLEDLAQNRYKLGMALTVQPDEWERSQMEGGKA